MSTKELTMMSDICPARERAEKNVRARVKKMSLASMLRAAFSSFVTAAGAASFGFGFALLAERQKDLGFIDVVIALAVTAGAALAVCGIVSLVRMFREGRSAAE